MGHSYGTLLLHTLVGHSCGSLLWDTLVGHSCGTHLWDTLVGHSCGTLIRDTLVGHSCGTLLWDTHTGHSCGTLLWDTLVGDSCGTLLWDTLVGHSCRAHSSYVTSSYETSSKSHAARLQDERFVRDFLQKSRVKSQKRAFRTRLPPKVTCQVPKTSVSYETSSKTHMSSPQNERFVRDVLKNSHVKVCKTNVSHKTSSKSPAETPIGAHTSRSPAKQIRDSSPSKRHPLTRQSQCDSDIHLYHNSQPPDSLRLPRIFSASTRLTRTKYCACHEMSPPSHLATSRFPAPATRIALPHLKSRTKYCACHEK